MGHTWQSTPYDARLRGVALVIEPNALQRAEIAVTLSAIGFKTHETGCGAVGQFIATQLSLDVMVVNVTLPDMDALQVIKRVRGLCSQAYIVATATSDDERPPLEMARRVGADVALRDLTGDALAAVLAARQSPDDEQNTHAD